MIDIKKEDDPNELLTLLVKADLQGVKKYIEEFKEEENFKEIISKKDAHNRNLIHSLIFSGYNQDNKEECAEIIEILIAHGAKIDEKDRFGNFPFDNQNFLSILKTASHKFTNETLKNIIKCILEENKTYSAVEIEIIDFLITEKKVSIQPQEIESWSFPSPEIKRKFEEFIKPYNQNIFLSVIPFFHNFQDLIFNRDNTIFSTILEDNPDKLNPEILNKQSLKEEDLFHRTPIFYAIEREKLNALEKIIQYHPRVLKQEDKMGLTPVFYAIANNKLNALEKIIQHHPEVLEQKDKMGLTPVFYAIKKENFDALEKIIQHHPEVLEQEYIKDFTPVFYAIKKENFDVLKKIISDNPEILKQNYNQLLYSLKQYAEKSSEKNKEILQFFFKKQIGRDLEEDEISNLGEFVKSYNFLKLFYSPAMGIKEDYFKPILLSFLPEETSLEDNLTKKLLKIYKKIAQEKSPVIKFADKSRLHVYNAELLDHTSYFIFHVNADNKIIKISYCDGNNFENGNIFHNFSQMDYSYGVKTFEAKELIEFSEEFVKIHIKKSSKEISPKEFYHKNLNLGKIRSISTKKQSRGNCTLKSINILARFLLEQQEKTPLFIFDSALGVQAGDGYGPYKHLKQRMVDQASEKLIECVEKLKEDFVDKVEVFEKIRNLLSKSELKETREKRGASTIRFLQNSPDFIDKINRKMFFNDEKLQNLRQSNYENFFISIFTLHLNLEEKDVDKIKFLLESERVSVGNFLNWKFQSTQAKNNFVGLVFKYGNQAKKDNILRQFSHSSPTIKDKFLKDLSTENLSLLGIENSPAKSDGATSFNSIRVEETGIRPSRNVKPEVQKSRSITCCFSFFRGGI
jgi:ankyrin repeat protein